jgi:uncharacterized protein YlzI (FlbEa/FlbD family)
MKSAILTLTNSRKLYFNPELYGLIESNPAQTGDDLTTLVMKNGKKYIVMESQVEANRIIEAATDTHTASYNNVVYPTGRMECGCTDASHGLVVKHRV